VESVLPEARTMRNEWLGPQLQRVMESGKVREAGLLSSKRGGFFLVDIDARTTWKWNSRKFGG
jgi:hypothetical protein